VNTELGIADPVGAEVAIQQMEALATPLADRTENDWMALFADVPVENFGELDEGALATEAAEDTSAAFFEAISDVVEDREMMEQVQTLLDAADLAIRSGHAGCMEEVLNAATHSQEPHDHSTHEDDEDDE
jgi:hypothetical protein